MKYFATFNSVSESNLLQVNKIMDEAQATTGVTGMRGPYPECPAEVRTGWYFDPQSGEYFSPERYEEVKEKFSAKGLKAGIESTFFEPRR
ncbi:MULTISPECIES: hypothetical protein [Pseudomonas]|jgi:hypothetical protein|uniref:Uncharacterized protein n=1 Tax=Pseudomonas moraviensis TaxID=321662 RepID=A0A7Y9W1J0_9PSED|nr:MULTISPECIES: hypothetical protein [Pseudomonas]MBX8467898.1 hypothetical protein [Pseudomonas sp. RIT778]NYH12597.1 hypothetical protein [Pseudomonas moraviensis]UVM29605.1 hypothetical protein LOY31_11210 [Pseudomonas sp. B21-021]